MVCIRLIVEERWKVAAKIVAWQSRHFGQVDAGLAARCADLPEDLLTNERIEPWRKPSRYHISTCTGLWRDAVGRQT